MISLLKKLYLNFPLKKELFLLIKNFWLPPESIYKHLYFKGKFKVNIDKSKEFFLYHNGLQIENEIFWNGIYNGWEKESMKLWIKLCETSNNIIDIGAHSGLYSLVAKAVNPKSSVFAFEPHPKIFNLLKHNISINNFDIKAFKIAISNKDGYVIIDDFSMINTKIKTQSITLDTFIKNNSIKNIDLMKIDVELHEPFVLEGFSYYLKQFKPTMLIEVLSQEVADKIYNYLKDLDYLFFNINEKGNIRQTDKIEKSDYYNYLLCNKNVAKNLNIIK
jgi:FkbM family methyltransferase